MKIFIFLTYLHFYATGNWFLKKTSIINTIFTVFQAIFFKIARVEIFGIFTFSRNLYFIRITPRFRLLSNFIIHPLANDLQDFSLASLKSHYGTSVLQMPWPPLLGETGPP